MLIRRLAGPAFVVYLVAALVAVLLAGCASRNAVESGGPTGGIVSAAFRSDSEAFAAANEHCARYGRGATITGVIRPGTWSFACR